MPASRAASYSSARVLDDGPPHLDVARHEAVEEVRVEQPGQLAAPQRRELLVELVRKVSRLKVRLEGRDLRLQIPEHAVGDRAQSQLRRIFVRAREPLVPVVAAGRRHQRRRVVAEAPQDLPRLLALFGRRLRAQPYQILLRGVEVLLELVLELGGGASRCAS